MILPRRSRLPGANNDTGSDAYDVRGVAYDKNGNLTSLDRHDQTGTPPALRSAARANLPSE